MAEVVNVTTSPVGERRGRFARWTTPRINRAGPGHLTFDPGEGFSRRYVEAVHDAALADGYESELVEFRPLSWALRVRKPGDPDGVPFVSEGFAPPGLAGGAPT
jgi:hypothetical protein